MFVLLLFIYSYIPNRAAKLSPHSLGESHKCSFRRHIIFSPFSRSFAAWNFSPLSNLIIFILRFHDPKHLESKKILLILEKKRRDGTEISTISSANAERYFLWEALPPSIDFCCYSQYVVNCAFTYNDGSDGKREAHGKMYENWWLGGTFNFANFDVELSTNVLHQAKIKWTFGRENCSPNCLKSGSF